MRFFAHSSHINWHAAILRPLRYTVDEIQDILGISRPTAYNLVKQGVFHSVRVGGHIRISKKSFDDWLDHADE